MKPTFTVHYRRCNAGFHVYIPRSWDSRDKDSKKDGRREHEEEEEKVEKRKPHVSQDNLGNQS